MYFQDKSNFLHILSLSVTMEGVALMVLTGICVNVRGALLGRTVESVSTEGAV